MNAGSDSDTSDEDYNPNAEKQEVLSEEGSNDDSEGVHSEDDSENKKRRKKATRKGRKKIRKCEEKETQSVTEKEIPEKDTSNPEDQKKRVDSLWADFMKDTGFKPRSELLKETRAPSKDLPKKEEPKKNEGNETEKKKEEKVKITQVFDFAGEEVRVEKEVSVDSVEAKKLNNVSDNSASSANSATKKTSRGGLSSVLSQIGKKGKISTLEKTKLDWERFKKEEQIEDELKSYSKSKDGYLERQDFLQRADLRQFEIEKGIRNSLRTNRINNS